MGLAAKKGTGRTTWRVSSEVGGKEGYWTGYLTAARRGSGPGRLPPNGTSVANGPRSGESPSVPVFKPNGSVGCPFERGFAHCRIVPRRRRLRSRPEHDLQKRWQISRSQKKACAAVPGRRFGLGCASFFDSVSEVPTGKARTYVRKIKKAAFADF